MLGSTTAPGRPGARAGAPSRVPSTQRTVSASRGCCFRGSIPSLCAPLSTLHQNPRGFQCMTRGQCGSLHLHWQRLALFTPCRSPGARIVNLTRSSRPSWPLSLERGQPYRRAKDFSAPNRRATDGRRILVIAGRQGTDEGARGRRRRSSRTVQQIEVLEIRYGGARGETQ